MSTKCHKWSRLDMTAAVCLACEPHYIARVKVAELEGNGYAVTQGYCSDCIARFKLDSFKGSRWELRGTGEAVWRHETVRA